MKFISDAWVAAAVLSRVLYRNESTLKSPNLGVTCLCRVLHTKHEAAMLPLSTIHLFSPSQHKPCLSLAPTLPPPPPPISSLSSMPPWTCMRRRQKTSFAHIHLPPGYNPATPPPPFYLSCKTSSSNLIVIAGAMRG